MYQTDLRTISRSELAPSSCPSESPEPSVSRAETPDADHEQILDADHAKADQEDAVKRRLAELLGDVATVSAVDGEKPDDEDVAMAAAPAPEQENETGEALYAFKLFAGPTVASKEHQTAAALTRPAETPMQDGPVAAAKQSAEETIQYIRLASPEPIAHHVHIAVEKQRARHRPLSYYLSPAPSQAKQEEYKAAALDGQYILNVLAQQQRPGCAYSWRVTKLTALKTKTPTSTSMSSANNTTEPTLPTLYTANTTSSSSSNKRKRLGKKGRILIRKKMAKEHDRAAQKQKEQAAKKEQEREKEEYLKEKKRQLNRKKQLKKREKKRVIGDDEDGGEGSVVGEVGGE